MANFLTKLLTIGEGKQLKGYESRVARINELEPSIQALSDEELARKTVEFRERLENGEELNDLLPEAFAVVREGGVRSLGMRHFDVQLIGGMVLNDGTIAEMKTGEGKTLVATLAAYLNALPGKGVHVVTVNDYLAGPRLGVDGPAVPVPRHGGRHHPGADDAAGPASRLRAPTSPTARTPSSASTTSATTWSLSPRTACSADTTSRSWTRSTRS